MGLRMERTSCVIFVAKSLIGLEVKSGEIAGFESRKDGWLKVDSGEVGRFDGQNTC